jgi:hypothetical protein
VLGGCTRSVSVSSCGKGVSAAKIFGGKGFGE